MKEIIIDVSNEGEIQIETRGFKGKSCIKESQFMKDLLGKEITQTEFNKLLELEKKIGFNVAGEGGEYESFVLDCPLFEKKIVLKGKTELENEFTGRFVVKEAKLLEK